MTFPNANSESFGFDDADQLTGIAYKQGAAILGNLTYGYDLTGERSTVGGRGPGPRSRPP